MSDLTRPSSVYDSRLCPGPLRGYHGPWCLGYVVDEEGFVEEPFRRTQSVLSVGVGRRGLLVPSLLRARTVRPGREPVGGGYVPHQPRTLGGGDGHSALVRRGPVRVGVSTRRSF